MNDILISLKTAKIAKEKGFPQGDLAGGCYTEQTDYNTGDRGQFINHERFRCVTQSLLQKWLREKHNIHIYVETTPKFDKLQGNKWKVGIKYCFQPFRWTTGHYYLGNTYEEALEQGLQEALKLI